MAFVGGGALAAAVSRAGGLGLIGGGYGDPEWIEEEFQAAQGERVGVGFITWSAARRPSVMDTALAHRPAAVMLSFGDPLTFAADIKAAGAILICQCQNLGHVRAALDAKADIVVAQGAEAGGHGADRGTFTLVPEVADLLAHASPDTMLVAAGGVADGRGLAAALTLGADGCSSARDSALRRSHWSNRGIGKRSSSPTATPRCAPVSPTSRVVALAAGVHGPDPAQRVGQPMARPRIGARAAGCD